MKRIFFMTGVLLLAVCVAGCGAGRDDDAMMVDPNAVAAQTENAADSATTVPDASEGETEDTLYFESNGVKVRTYDMADDAISSLGEPNGTFEAASCAYQGLDLFYYYDGFQLTVNKVDDADHVTVIMIVDDTVAIPQGVKIGSTKDEMLSLMGDDFEESSGLYAFIEGDTTLQIQIKEESVASIMYVYTPKDGVQDNA